MEDEKASILEKIGEHPFLMPLLASIPIPIIGNSISVAISSLASKFSRERLETLIENLREYMKHVDEKKVDKSYLESEEFYDLVREVFEATLKTRDREKIDLYARILSNSVVPDSRKKFSPEGALSALKELNIDEIRLIKTFYEKQVAVEKEKENELKWALELKRKVCEELGIDEAVFEFMMKRLERVGFVKELQGYWDYEGGAFVVTDAFKKMMDFLKDPRE